MKTKPICRKEWNRFLSSSHKIGKPVIGLTPDFNAGNRKDMGGKEPTYFLRARYLQAIQEAGGVPLVLPLVLSRTQQTFLLQRLDGLLVTGSGSDLAPGFYGEAQQYPFQQMSEERARLELGLSKLAFEHQVPTLGICGGMQSMNVALGGTLIQDIPAQIATKIQHLQKKSAEHTKAIPRSLHTSAIAPDGVIEAIEAASHPFWLGVQWHPEFLYRKDVLQKRLFSAFVKAARHYASN
jgi:putative glutamine amidotransferase